jgi:hypothetical protein
MREDYNLNTDVCEHLIPHHIKKYHTIPYNTIPHHTFIPYLSLSALNMILIDSNFRDQELILP